MARPVKRGLDSFPLDVDIFHDEKIVGISGEFGIKGEVIVIRLLCAIYRNGYFALWDDRLIGNMHYDMRGSGVGKELIRMVVERLVKNGFFDSRLFMNESVLTSESIQKRYFSSISRRQRMESYPHLLIQISGKRKTSAAPLPPTPDPTPMEARPFIIKPYTLTYEEEVSRMKNDEMWLDNIKVSRGVGIEWLHAMLDKFLLHCKEYKPRHTEYRDATSHFLNWLYKQPKPINDNPPAQSDYIFDGFGGIDT